MALSLRKSTLAGLLGALALSVASPAQARDRYNDDDGDDAALAIGAGVIGLALGAALASDRDDRYYRDDHYYYDRGYYPRRSYYRYDHYPRYNRHDRRWRGRDWNGGWRGRGYDRGWRGQRGGHDRGWRGRGGW